MTHPTRVVIDEPAVPVVGALHFDLRHTTLRAAAPIPWRIGQSTPVTMTAKAGRVAIIGAALDPSPGINTPIGDVMVDLDALLFFSLDPTNGIFTGNVGVIGPDGTMTASVLLPNVPGIVGFTFFMGGVAFDTNGQPAAVTQSVRAIIAP